MVRKSTPARALISPVCSKKSVVLRHKSDIQGKKTYVAEGSTHDDGVVPMLLVVVEDPLDGLHAWVFVALVIFPCLFLVPVQDLQVYISQRARVRHIQPNRWGGEANHLPGRQRVRSE